MKSIQFNVNGPDQHVVFENEDGGLNPRDAMTVEVLCELLCYGEDPTIFSLPAGEKWEAPFIAWRLGFHGQHGVPEFQVTIEGDGEPTTARSQNAVGQYEVVHLAGTYDGSAVRLYVNGKLEAEVAKTGKVLESKQRVSAAARSSTALGGLLVGRLFEMRLWEAARAIEEIDNWKDKSLPLPAPPSLCGLWRAEPGLDSIMAKHLASNGFSPIEISLSSFVTAYADAYSTIAPEILTGIAKEQFAHKVHALVGRTADGYVVLYESSPRELLAGIASDPDMAAASEFFAFNWEQYTLSDVLQMVSGNGIRICTRLEDKDGKEKFEIPKERADTIPTSVNPRLKQANISPPEILIIEEPGSKPIHGRIRLVSPLVTLEGGDTIRAFPWLFADIWFGELSWDIARMGLSDYLAVNDAMGLNGLAGGPLVSPQVVEPKTHQPLLPLERVIAEFETLITKDDVEEVRDVLPFLGKPDHWIILSPTAQHVWPEKMLGNKWRVDFVVRESDGTYTATEVESPKKRLYKTGQSVEPYAEWMHAEQQVRDYCNFIDTNRDYVEREEGLTGILRPRGLVIIGRRETLTDNGKKKLAERNIDNGRYQTITFDDLLDQAKTVVQRLKTLIAPNSF
jgi:hypothetical protein